MASRLRLSSKPSPILRPSQLPIANVPAAPLPGLNPINQRQQFSNVNTSGGALVPAGGISSRGPLTTGTRTLNTLPPGQPYIDEQSGMSLDEVSERVGPLTTYNIVSTDSEFSELIPEYVTVSLFNDDDVFEPGSNAIIINSEAEFGLGTLNDPRLGTTTDDNQFCATCNKQFQQCSGHYGYIKLFRPIYHPLFIPEVIMILNSVCNKCGGLLLTPEFLERKGAFALKGLDRLKFISELSQGKPCSTKTQQITQQGVQGEAVGPVQECIKNHEFDNKRSQSTKSIQYKVPGSDTRGILPIEDVQRILNRITPAEGEILGFTGDAHPRHIIKRAILVVPPCSLSLSIVNGELKQDPIVEKYRQIIKANRLLGEQFSIQSQRDHYYTEIIRIFSEIIERGSDSDSRNFKIRGLGRRLQGKRGVFRGMAMGKRVNYAARTVIGPDPALRFGQVGIPRKMAAFLTVPVTVTTENQKFIDILAQSGQITRIIPGSGREKGHSISVKGRIRGRIRPGDIVHRYLQNGDYVLLNRQPTLHKQGIMGAEVRLFSNIHTIRFPLAYTPAYNADFDGDEMNIHMVQTEAAMAEVRNLMNLRNCLMNAQTSRPAMAPVMDALTGVYKLTQPDTEIPIELWNDLMLYIEADDKKQLNTLDERLKRHGVKKYTGRALFSALLPEDFFYTAGSSGTGAESVIILDGILVSGVLNKTHIGISEVSMVIELYRRYGSDRASDFISDAAIVIDQWWYTSGFTVEIADCLIEDPEFKKILRRQAAHTRLMASSVETNLTDPIEKERQENEITTVLNDSRDIGFKAAKARISETNNLNVMAQAKAKGSLLNITQITSSVGQQFLRSKRIEPSASGRTLPYFTREEVLTNPEARGYIFSSFSTELPPAGYFFHQMAGRENLAAVAVGTAGPGALHHRIGKVVETLRVNEDGSVRNFITGDIIQFSYGYDGFSASEMQQVSFGTQTMLSFINLDQIIGQINASFGYYPEVTNVTKLPSTKTLDQGVNVVTTGTVTQTWRTTVNSLGQPDRFVVKLVQDIMETRTVNFNDRTEVDVNHIIETSVPGPDGILVKTINRHLDSHTVTQTTTETSRFENSGTGGVAGTYGSTSMNTTTTVESKENFDANGRATTIVTTTKKTVLTIDQRQSETVTTTIDVVTTTTTPDGKTSTITDKGEPDRIIRNKQIRS